VAAARKGTSIMVKKLKALSEKQATGPAGLLDSPLANTVKDSAQQIWLAGLGAFSKAQAEGGKVFDALVKEGVSLQRKTQTVAEDKITEVTSKMTNMAGGLSGKATQHWDKLETIFEERVAKALNRLGVPSAKDVDALMARIDALSASVAKLSGAPAKSAAAKPAAKKAAAKKTAAKKAAKPAAKRAARKTAAA
jgi:poly(hydroxyalkanoate) granule-associated protein